MTRGDLVTDPLEAPRLKLQRAAEHVDALDEAFEQFKARVPYGFILEGYSEEGPQGRLNVFRFEVREQPPRQLGLIIGDAVTNLRAALDHLAWQLAIRYRGGRRPDTRTAFPIYKEAARYSIGSLKPLKHIAPEARVEIERLQPYHQSKRPEAHLLWVLNEMAVRDKHQVLNTVFGYPHIRSSAGRELRITQPLTDGYRLYVRIEPANYERELYFSAEIGAEVDGSVVGPRGLRAIHDFIGDDVFPRFARFLE